MATGTQEDSKKKSLPQLVKFGKAFKLAEQWVDNMTRLVEDDKSTKVKLESRPPRLGIGAAVPRESKVTLSSDPVERKIQAKLNADKRRAVKNAEELAKDSISHEDSDEEELESRTQAFTKRRLPITSSLSSNKKQRCI